MVAFFVLQPSSFKNVNNTTNAYKGVTTLEQISLTFTIHPPKQLHEFNFNSLPQ